LNLVGFKQYKLEAKFNKITVRQLKYCICFISLY